MSLTRQDTLRLKGFAILLMLIHHLFYIQNGLFDDVHLIGNHYFVNDIGKIAKVCVSIFVFLSGYGLAVSVDTHGTLNNGLWQFYCRRFKKLFLNYWIVWALFVPVTVLVFNYSFIDAYHNHIFFHLITDLLGVHSVVYYNSYCFNPTWWFYSCIIVLYLAFPLLYEGGAKNPITTILATIAVSFLPLPQIVVIKFYMLSFVLGIIMATRKVTVGSPKQLLVVLILLVLERNISSEPILIDCFITVAIVMIYNYIDVPKPIIKCLEFFGKHSMNIFLFHTFIYYIWYPNLIYATRNPIIIFISLLAVCIPISVFLEFVKKYTIYKI